MKEQEPFAIASNDDRLAHGTAKYLADVTPMRRCLEQLRTLGYRKALSVKFIESAIPESLKKYILHRVIFKPSGSRAKAIWFLVAPMQNDFAFTSIALRKTEVYIFSPSIRVTHHCLARVMQRASKTSDLTKTLRWLDKPLISLYMELTRIGAIAEPVPTGITAELFVREGKIICASENDYLYLKTFVNSEKFHKNDKKIIGEHIYDEHGISVHWGTQPADLPDLWRPLWTKA